MRYRFKPSKPAALFTTVVATLIFALGITSMHRFTAFGVVWVVGLVGIVLFNLWAAFSPRGSMGTMYTVERTDRDSGVR
jgi:ABC-type transport system involved in cytochrome c biogenesis permease subunit